jgi:hypothetical protein
VTVVTLKVVVVIVFESRERLMKPGSLRPGAINLPQALRDAITLVKKLGMRHLWVDAICLIQDDPLDIKRGLAAMGDICERATVIIVAASGDDADAGPSGVQRGSRKRDEILTEVLPNMRLGLIVSPDHLFKRSAYETRAWTMQEHLFHGESCTSSTTKSSFGAEKPSASRAAMTMTSQKAAL